jgi:CRISPR-associated protein Cmr6
MRRQHGQRNGRPPTDAGRPVELPLPYATRQVFASRLERCRNVGLLFDRYPRFQGNWQLGTYKDGGRDRSAKLFNIEEIAEAQERCKKDPGWQEMHRQFVARWRTSAHLLAAEPFPKTADWRLVVGLGDRGALEMGFTFHRIYGFPIIPGSAVKGLARAAALCEIAEAEGVSSSSVQEAGERTKRKRKTPLEKLEVALLARDERVTDLTVRRKMQGDEAEALQALREEAPEMDWGAHQSLIGRFRAVFGTLHAAGQSIFLDGVPAEPPTLKPDVMNVHYAEYYRGPKPPTDYLNPNPIPFLTVAGESPFLFAVGWRGVRNEGAHAAAEGWLKKGLSELGVGAKTAAGYGYFK